VTSKAANELGLYDRSGNVWEWCWDWLGDYPERAESDPAGLSSGTFRILRGGCWNNSSGYARSAFRFSASPWYSYDMTSGSGLGFRLVRAPVR